MGDFPTTTAIEASALGKIYRSRNEPPTRALAEVSLSVPTGQFVGIVGMPGSGKTTLLKLIGGVLRPTTGRANLFGYDVIRQAGDARALVRLASIDARTVHWRSTIRETVFASAERAGLTGTDRVSRAACILERLGLRDGAQLSPWHGSPWLWTRLGLALALLADPKIVLVDEPTAGLDETDARAFMGALGELVRAHGKTVVVASQQVGLVREFCDRIVVLNRGRLAVDCRALDLRRVRLAQVYRITLGGQLDDGWSDWFDGMRVDASQTGTTVLIGPVPDQSALHGLLARVRDLGLPLLALSRVEPDARDVLDLWRSSGGRFDGAERPSDNGHLG